VATIAILSGSPSAQSRTLLLARHVASRLHAEGFDTELLSVRDLPAEDLLFGNVQAPRIKAAVELIARSPALVLATPIYKAALAGALKAFLDLLPQFALAEKVVLPLATGGSLAHVMAIDYALRPVLASLAARHVVNGWFFLDKQLERVEPDGLRIDPAADEKFQPVFRDFVTILRAHLPPP